MNRNESAATAKVAGKSMLNVAHFGHEQDATSVKITQCQR